MNNFPSGIPYHSSYRSFLTKNACMQNLHSITPTWPLPAYLASILKETNLMGESKWFFFAESKSASRYFCLHISQNLHRMVWLEGVGVRASCHGKSQVPIQKASWTIRSYLTVVPVAQSIWCTPKHLQYHSTQSTHLHKNIQVVREGIIHLWQWHSIITLDLKLKIEHFPFLCSYSD